MTGKRARRVAATSPVVGATVIPFVPRPRPTVRGRGRAGRAMYAAKEAVDAFVTAVEVAKRSRTETSRAAAEHAGKDAWVALDLLCRMIDEAAYGNGLVARLTEHERRYSHRAYEAELEYHGVCSDAETTAATVAEVIDLATWRRARRGWVRADRKPAKAPTRGRPSTEPRPL